MSHRGTLERLVLVDAQSLCTSIAIANIDNFDYKRLLLKLEGFQHNTIINLWSKQWFFEIIVHNIADNEHV